MASAANKTCITPEEYLARERSAVTKSEYYDGQIYAMAGTTRPHNLLAANLSRLIGNAIEHRACELYIADMRVRVDATGLYAYPDLAVVCGEPRFVDGESDTLLNPTLIVEILSPSTEKWDRGGKFANYRRLESLQDYLLVSQDKILLEHYSRQGDQWLLTERNHPDQVLRLTSIDCEISLREVYAKVNFEPDDAGPAG
jgi:Uma2 family endonuclease